MPSATDLRNQFRSLHQQGTFVMPNPHDVGTTKLLTTVGFDALATTSAGFASTLGRLDMTVARDELVEHVGRLTAATHLPFNVDSERLYGDDAAGIAECVALLAGAGAAGCSIEDWNPATDQIDPLEVSVARVGAAAEEARRHGIVLTGRCENHLHGVDDLDDTIARLCAYRDAGAEVVYAPGLVDVVAIGRVVNEVGVPVNVLLLPGGPNVAALAAAGVRRVSLGSFFANVANAAVINAATQLRDAGTIDAPPLDRSILRQAFAT
ncbi:MAG: isocitrate lyase/phosphoenolpyruvate mutase family protein [Actinomycetota bacterium]|nr:isocitrate lyase/phosphoenolpyruvate mutase family protein [Actinomycetota bacterium]